nr:MAG TPA: hypothetical protein [Caudoviricetes sp.]
MPLTCDNVSFFQIVSLAFTVWNTVCCKRGVDMSRQMTARAR